MSINNEILQKKFNELKEMKGSFKENLLNLGFRYKGNKEKAENIDEFRQIVNESDYANSEKLIKYFGEYLSYRDVCEILKIGDNGFSDNEIIDAFKIIPCTPNLQISVKDFINILY